MVIDVGDDSLLSTALSKHLLSHAKLNTFDVYSFEQKTVSLLRWKHIVEMNGTKNALINAPPNHPDLGTIFTEGSVGGIVWDCHHYQMEDHSVMAAISYWCMANALRSM